MEDDAENFPRNAECLPLCFASLLREHYKQVVNRKNEECSNVSVEENRGDTKADPEVQPLSLFESQTSDEIMKPEIGNEHIHCDSLPLCFNSFQILRGNFGQILVESHSVNHEVPVGPVLPLSEAFYDPIADILDEVCFQSLFSFTPNELKKCYNMDMIRQSSPLSGSTEISVQNPSDEIQTHLEMSEDLKTSQEKQGQEMEWTDSKCQGTTQVYFDPIDIYMENFFRGKATIHFQQFSCSSD
jgi:hypothetical protein